MLSRREMILISATGMLSKLTAAFTADGIPVRDGIPRVDYHVHVGDEVSVDQAVELSKRRDVNFGLLQRPPAEKGSNDPS